MDITLSGRTGRCLTAAAVYAVSCIVFSFIFGFASVPSIVAGSYQPIGEALASGTSLYGGGYYWDLPHLAYLFVWIPALVTSSSGDYQIVFALLTVPFACLGAWCTDRMAERFGYSVRNTVILYTALLSLLAVPACDGVFLPATALAILAFVLMIEDRNVPAFLCLALSFLIGGFTLFLLPVMMSYVWYVRDRKESLIGTSVFAIVSAVAFAAVYAAGSDPSCILGNVLSRPIEFMSSFATITELLGLLGLTSYGVTMEGWYTCLTGSLPEAFGLIILPLAVVVLCMLHSHYPYWLHRKGVHTEYFMENTAVMAMLSILTVTIVSNTLVPQVTVWTVPFAVFYFIVSRNPNERDTVMEFLLAAAVMDIFAMVFGMGLRPPGSNPDIIAVGFIGVRNLYYLVPYLLLTRRLIVNDRGRNGPGRDLEDDFLGSARTLIMRLFRRSPQ